MPQTSMQKLGIQGLGWVVRRAVVDHARLIPFYQAALSVRQLRPAGPGGTIMLWAGDIVMLETAALNPTAESEARKHDLTVVMRARQYDLAKMMVFAAGAKVVGEETSGRRMVTFTDPDGFLFGMRDAGKSSSLAPDALADAIWRKGPVTLPETPALSPEFQDVAALQLKVADPVAMAAFYADLFGLQVLGKATPAGAALWFGRTAVLELQPGGAKRGIPGNRDQVPDVWILRVYDHAGMLARLKAKGVAIVNELRIAGGTLTYAADPEGHVFGFQQRTPETLPEGGKERLEDVMARRLWAEG